MKRLLVGLYVTRATAAANGSWTRMDQGVDGEPLTTTGLPIMMGSDSVIWDPRRRHTPGSVPWCCSV